MSRPYRTFSSIAVAVVAATFVAGCPNTDDATTDSEKTKSGRKAVAANGNGNGKPKPSGPWKGELPIVVGGWKDLKSRIDANKGKVVVVDFWSTWCAPCKTEMPNLVRLQKQHGDKVAAITANLNYYGDADSAPEKTRDEIESTIRELFGKALSPDEKLEPAIPVFISNVADEPFYKEVGKKLFNDENAITAVPTIIVIAKDGRPTKLDVDSLPEGDKELTYEKHVNPLVEKLLAEQL